jgi:hypothetical protein
MAADGPATASATAADMSSASDALKRSTAAAESLRQRSDLAAKLLASGGSTLVTAIGISKFADLWPFPGGIWSGVAIAVVVLGFAAMVFAVFAIAYRHWKLHQPTPFRSNLGLMEEQKELSDSELKLVEPIYEEFARLNQVESMETYEARAHRFERIARWLPDTEAGRVRGDSTLMQTEVLATLARAKLRVLRDRATVAVRGKGAIWLYGLFAAGVLAFGLGADWLQSERTDKVTVAKACADARAVSQVVEERLPGICGEPATEEAETKSVSSEIADTNVTLASAYAECLGVATTASDCDPIKDAMDALLPT